MARVLVTGIAVVDFVFQTKEMPRLAQKYRADHMEIVGGGIAANAAVAIARLGGAACLMTRLGDDAVATTICADLEAEGVDLSPTVQTKGGRSPVSTVTVDGAGERMLMNFPGAGLAETAVPPQDFDAVLVDSRWPAAALASLEAARARGKPGVLDGEAPVDPRLVAVASHVIFSAQGLRDFTGAATVEQGLARIDAPGWVAATDGARGVAVRGADPLWTPGFRVAVKDTLGAGDVWHGAFALALAEGQSETEAIIFAHATAALKCTAFGGRKATPTRAAVDHFIKDHAS